MTNMTVEQVKKLCEKYNLFVIKHNSSFEAKVQKQMYNDTMFSFKSFDGMNINDMLISHLQVIYFPAENNFHIDFITDHMLTDDKIYDYDKLEDYIQNNLNAIEQFEMVEKKMRMQYIHSQIKKDFNG